MNREESRPFTGTHGMRNGRSWLWEHVQIDVAMGELSDGEESIYLFRDWGIEIRGVAVEGAIVDFRLLAADGLTIKSTLPPFDLSSESYGPYRHSLVYRSWNVPSLGLTIHVESWVEKGRGGFVDLFTKSEGA